MQTVIKAAVIMGLGAVVAGVLFVRFCRDVQAEQALNREKLAKLAKHNGDRTKRRYSSGSGRHPVFEPGPYDQDRGVREPRP